MANVGCYLGNVNSSVMSIFACDSEKGTKFLKKMKKTAKGESTLQSSAIMPVDLALQPLRQPINAKFNNI